MFSILVLQKPSLIFLLPGTLGVDKREILGNAGNIFPNLGTYSDVHVCPTNSNEKKKKRIVWDFNLCKHILFHGNIIEKNDKCRI